MRQSTESSVYVMPSPGSAASLEFFSVISTAPFEYLDRDYIIDSSFLITHAALAPTLKELPSPSQSRSCGHVPPAIPANGTGGPQQLRLHINKQRKSKDFVM